MLALVLPLLVLLLSILQAERFIRGSMAQGGAHILVSITPEGEAQSVDRQVYGEPLGKLLTHR